MRKPILLFVVLSFVFGWFPLSEIPKTESTEVETITAKEEIHSEIEVPSLATEYDIELLARTIWGEAGGIKSKAERAAVAWCVLNRVDAQARTISSVILAPNQFAPRLVGNIPEEHLELAKDVVERWEKEHAGYEDVGRTLPADYFYFSGDGKHNHFSKVWRSGIYWDWSLPDPYTQEN